MLDVLHQHLPWTQPLHSVVCLQLSVRLPQGLEAALTRQAPGLGIATSSLRALYHGEYKLDGWRLGLAALQPDDIVVAARRLATPKPKARS